MTYPAVFAAGAGHPFSDEFQDMIREHMLSKLPRIPEPTTIRKDYKRSTDDAFARRRAKISPYAVRMREEGMSIHAISEQFGVSHNTIRRILKEASDNVPAPELLPPLSAPARLCGCIDKWHTSRSDDRDEWLANAHRIGYATSQMAQALNISTTTVQRIIARMEAA